MSNILLTIGLRVGGGRDDAPGRVHAVGTVRRGRRRHDRARRRPPARRRPRHRVRRPGDLRTLPGRALDRRVRQVEHHRRPATSSTAWSALERDYRGGRPLGRGHRLGCAAAIHGDVVIDVPAASQVHRQVVRKELRLDLPELVVDPLFAAALRRGRRRPSSGRACRPPTSSTAAVADQHGDVGRRRSPPTVLPSSARGDRRRHGDRRDPRRPRASAIWPGFVDEAYGVAVDVGSTTIAGHLCDLFGGDVVASGGRMNPQIRFGEDLMSRVSYVMMNPGGDRAAHRRRPRRARRADRRAARRRRRAPRSGARRRDRRQPDHAPPRARHRSDAARQRAVHAGDERRRVRRAPPTSGSTCPSPRSTPARASPATSAPTPRRWCSPRARTAASDMQLVVDVGTNAEIVLGDHRHQFAASSPTGPAFEGAQISCGQRATAGAVEAVRIDPQTLRARGQGDRRRRRGATSRTSRPAVAATGVTGLCGSGIIDLLAEMYLAGLLDADGTIVGDNASRTDRVVADGRTFRYVFYRDDRTRAVDHAERRARRAARQGGAARRHRPAARARRQPDRHRHPPRRRLRRTHRPAARDGPRAGPRLPARRRALRRQRRRRRCGDGAAVGVGARARWRRRCASIDKIETATEPRFQELFVAAMALPHATAPTDQLAALGDPAPAPIGDRRDSKEAHDDAISHTAAGPAAGPAARRCAPRPPPTPTPS